MHKVIFYPVGNGDTSQIILANGKRILFDFRHLACGEDEHRPELDLTGHLRDELAEAETGAFDVVAFTHGDDDHIAGSTEFFELQHAKKYRGGDRVKIGQLWVPAGMILEEGAREDRGQEVIVWRQEARYRLREGRGIRVFSKPDKLKSWLEANDLSVESRRHLITDAGQLVPEFNLIDDGVEFFCHSPFIKHSDGGDIVRNDSALIFNVRFVAGNQTFDYLAVGDSTSDVLEDIVATTVAHKNEDRLAWDLYNIPHHCSYKALNVDEKGEKATTPVEGVSDLLRRGRTGAYLVSSSLPIDDDKEGRERVQPPHVQAKRAYVRCLNEVSGGKFLVTMEEPSRKKPKPIVFEISGDGIKRLGTASSGADSLISNAAPRAG